MLRKHHGVMFLTAKCEAAMPQARQTFEKKVASVHQLQHILSVTIKYGSVPEWPKGADCKSVVFDFGGSNPPAPTKTREYHRKVGALLVCG